MSSLKRDADIELAMQSVQVLAIAMLDFVTTEPGDGSSVTDADYRIYLTRDLCEGTFVSLYKNKPDKKVFEVQLHADMQIDGKDTMLWFQSGKLRIFSEFRNNTEAHKFSQQLHLEHEKLLVEDGEKRMERSA
jgi:hypothetical protein